jgi:hypothetical protein
MRTLWLGLLLAGAAFGQTSIATCGSYGAGTYVLTADLISTSGDCLDFDGSSTGSVQLNGAGHSIQSDHAAIKFNHVTGYSFINSMTISPYAATCSISGLCEAINIQNYTAQSVPGFQMVVQGVTVLDAGYIYQTPVILTTTDSVVISNSTFPGLVISGNSSISVTSVTTDYLQVSSSSNGNYSNLMILNPHASANGAQDGIILSNSSNNTFQGISISQFGRPLFPGCGIRFNGNEGSPGTSYVGNVFSNININGGNSPNALGGICYQYLGLPFYPSPLIGNTFQGITVNGVQYGEQFIAESRFSGNIDSGNVLNGSIAAVQNELYQTMPSGGASGNIFTHDTFQINGQPATPDFCGTLSDCGVTTLTLVVDGGSNLGVPSPIPNFPLNLSTPAIKNPSITYPPALNSGVVGTGLFPQTFAASGGSGSYAWSATGLPAGITLSGAGVLSGTPSASGSFTPSVTVSDTVLGTGTSQNFSQTVNTSLGITTTSLPAATQNSAYTATVSASGGTTPYTWTASLPTGLSINSSTGVISGTPVQVLGVANSSTGAVLIQVNDAASHEAQIILTLLVLPPVPPAGSVNVTSCATPINAANTVYLLNADIGSVSSPCALSIEIAPGPPSVLDCQVHTIYGTITIGNAFASGDGPLKIQNCTISPPPQYQGQSYPLGTLVTAVSSFASASTTWFNNTILSGSGSKDFASRSTFHGQVTLLSNTFQGSVFVGSPNAIIQGNVILSSLAAGGDELQGDTTIQLEVFADNPYISGNTILGQCNDGLGLQAPSCPRNVASAVPGVSFGDSNIILQGAITGGTITGNYCQHTGNANIELAHGPISGLTVSGNTGRADPNAFTSPVSFVYPPYSQSGLNLSYLANMSNSTIQNNTFEGPYFNGGMNLNGQFNAQAVAGTGLLTNVAFNNNSFSSSVGSYSQIIGANGTLSVAGLETMMPTQLCVGASCSIPPGGCVPYLTAGCNQIPYGSGVTFYANEFSQNGTVYMNGDQLQKGSPTFISGNPVDTSLVIIDGGINLCTYPDPTRSNASPYPNPFSCNQTSSLSISTSSLAAATLGSAYTPVTLTATGVSGTPYWYGVGQGTNAGLPPGMVVNRTTGVLSGTPTARGTYSVILVVEDTSSAQVRKTLPLVVN